MPKKRKNLVGAVSFLIGFILAIIFGLLGMTELNVAVFILFLIGVIIGLLNIADEEVKPFLLAGTVLVLVSYLAAGVIPSFLNIDKILGAMVVLFAPATLIVALKSLFSLARR